MKLNIKWILLLLTLSLGGALVGCGNNVEEQSLEVGEVVHTKIDKEETTDKQGVTEESQEEVKSEIKEETPKEQVQVNMPQKEEVAQVEEQPAIKPQTQPEVKPEVIPENKPVMKPEIEIEDKPEAKPEVKPEPVRLSASEIVTQITAGLDMPAKVAMDESTFMDTYGIDSSLLVSYQVDMPMMIVHASEVGVFEVRESENASKILEGIQKRQRGLDEIWSTYLPDQYELVKNYKIAQKGNYILFVISEEADTIVNHFNTLIE